MASAMFEQRLAHVLWWLGHSGGLAVLCVLPSDLHVGEGVTVHRWVAAIALSLNVLAHYAVRLSDPGWVNPVIPLDAPRANAKFDSGAAAADCEAVSLLTTTSAAAAPADPALCCPQCGCLRRAPATTHCCYCNRCVEGFDHHCMWLGVCVGGRNHHLFARYLAVQTAVVLLGFHYALTACGRPSTYGQTWAYGALALLALLALPLALLTGAHVLLVLTGQTSRQVLQRVRGLGSGGSARPRQTGSFGREMGLARLSAGQVLQNCCHLLCGVRPAWFVTSAWVQMAGAWLARAVNNRYYSCC